MSTPDSTQGSPSQQPTRRKADWEAIERDYRTGRFTDQELVDKHGNVVTRQALSKRAKVKGWQKDLSTAVRQATKAKLIQDQVAKRLAAEVTPTRPGKVAKKLQEASEATSIVAEATAATVDATATAGIRAAAAWPSRCVAPGRGAHGWSAERSGCPAAG